MTEAYERCDSCGNAFVSAISNRTDNGAIDHGIVEVYLIWIFHKPLVVLRQGI